MERHRLPRRSASHGALHSGYVTHGRLLHKPLRSVNENSALFPSPGPLESMLKTTTETGDIGIFSIKPVSSCANLGIPRGTRHPIEVNGRTLPLANRIEDRYRQDHRKGMPGYRDTTSEILSMYGSTSQSSLGSNLSPSMDEFGRRSYSMTTCASRHLSHDKTDGPWTCHASEGRLQRPRSPFPYPTRLKRPGARPASPAITENGLVDYSRMVEIDRISLRTVHGSYKPYYPHPVPNPLPLGIRSDANLSTPSLLGHGPRPMQNLRPRSASLRTVSVASTASRNPPYRESFNSLTSRTPNLTSVVNMYQRLPTGLKASHIGMLAPQPRYYDYTEEFEIKVTHSTTPIEPIAPIPRAASVQNPLVLREGSDEQLAAALGLEAESTWFDDESQLDDALHEVASDREDCDEQVQSVSSSTQQDPDCMRTTDIGVAITTHPNSQGQTCRSDRDLLPSQIGRTSVGTCNPSLDLESRERIFVEFPRYPTRAASKPETASPSPARQVQLHGHETLTIRSEKGSIRETRADESGEDQQEEDRSRGEAENATSVPRHPSTEQPHPVLLEDPPSLPTKSSQRFPKETHRTPNTTIRRSQLTEWNTELGDTLISPVSENATTPRTEEAAKARKPSPSVKSIDKGHSQVVEEHDQRDSEENHELDAEAIPKASIESQPLRRRHKRNQAVLRIETKDLPTSDRRLTDDIPQLSPSASTVPLYSPKPISPARHLKVKNSIPQLMKALPPIPPDADNGSWSGLTADDDDELMEILEPYRMSRSGTPKAAKTSQNPPNLHKKLRKIKLKRDSRPWKSDNDYPWPNRIPDNSFGLTGSGDEARTVPKAKFKLRIGRPGGMDAQDAETVRRRPDARKPEILADLVDLKAKDLFSSLRFPSSSQRRVTPSAHSDSSTLERAVLDNVFVGQVNVRSFSFRQALQRKRPRHARKSLSNLRSLLAKTTKLEQSETTPTEKDALSKLSTIRSGGCDSRRFHYNGNGISSLRSSHIDVSRRQCFRRRVRKRLSSWVKRTRAMMRKNRHRNVSPA